MKLRYYIMLFALLAMASCKKNLVVKDAPDFSVSTDSATYKAGTPVTFNIKGGADVISFYSGEVLHDYAFKDGRQVDVSGQGVIMSFTNGVYLGSQANQFSILYSTDFDGNYGSLASVKLATWTDITSRFVLATTASSTPTTSTSNDISNLLVAGKPLYIAFKYKNLPQVANGFSRQWMVQSFTLLSNAQFNGAPVTIANQIHMGFRIVDENPVNAPARSQITTTRITLYGNVYKDPNDPLFDPTNIIYDPANPIYNPYSASYISSAVRPVFVAYDPTSPYNDPQSENWAVSAPITLGKVELGNDRSVIVRSSVYAVKPTSYAYIYKNPGTYKAYFLTSNNTLDDSKQVVKAIDITITP
jgi:hypothetical protein